MKNLIFLLSLLVILFSCTENPPVIPALGGGGGGGSNEGERKVLIEEYTGVQCVNCPDGSAEIQNLLAVHGDRLVAVSIHSGYFSDPLPESTIDFRTADGDAVAGLFVEPSGYPAAIVNRKEFSGDIFTAKQNWAGHIANELEEKPKVDVDLMSDFVDASRVLKVTVTINPFEDVDEPLNVTVMLTENNVVNAQQFSDVLDLDYAHKHVFRRLITSTASGEIIGDSFVKEESVEKSFEITIPQEWNAAECHIIAFVHQTGSHREVLQVEEIKVK